jgi:hypothetical protein
MNDKERFEGHWSSKSVQFFRKVGYNKDVDIELATVTSPPPTLKIKVDNMKIELEGDDIIVAESLLEHTRTISITGGTVVGAMTSNTHNHTVSGYSHAHTESGGGTTSSDTHNHKLTDATHDHTVNKLDITSGTLTIESPLKLNDRVIVASVNDGQTYIVLDRAVNN